ncbi:MAG: transposase [Rhodospirillaceae bacterium]|nr:transposase [Rhodospirillaceae bacterium]
MTARRSTARRKWMRRISAAAARTCRTPSGERWPERAGARLAKPPSSGSRTGRRIRFGPKSLPRRTPRRCRISSRNTPTEMRRSTPMTRRLTGAWTGRTKRCGTACPNTSGTWRTQKGIEAFWSMIKRAHDGIFHKLSPKHLHRYVSEFAGKHNIRDLDTLAQMRDTVARLVGERLLWRDLVADNGLSNAARE